MNQNQNQNQNLLILLCTYNCILHYYNNFCVAAALRQERPPRRGARRVGEPTPQQSVNVKLTGKQELCPHGGFFGAPIYPRYSVLFYVKFRIRHFSNLSYHSG